MRLIITDDPVDDVKMAMAREKHDREQRISALVGSCHVSIMCDDDPVNVRLRIEDQFFSEPRERFPSIKMVADIELALAAGLSDRLTRLDEQREAEIMSYHATDALVYSHPGRRAPNYSWLSELVDRKVTATVKAPAKKFAQVRP